MKVHRQASAMMVDLTLTDLCENADRRCGLCVSGRLLSPGWIDGETIRYGSATPVVNFDIRDAIADGGEADRQVLSRLRALGIADGARAPNWIDTTAPATLSR